MKVVAWDGLERKRYIVEVSFTRSGCFSVQATSEEDAKIQARLILCEDTDTEVRWAVGKSWEAGEDDVYEEL
jgi:hypothetical protein